MNEIQRLFNLKRNEDGTVAVSGRELHKGLEVKTPYPKWINRMIAYGFCLLYTSPSPRDS